MSDAELTAGHILGRYELLLPVAKGGMAQVWAARLIGTRGFRKVVAVKTILRGCIDDTRMEQMFLEEATLAAQIHHPNVVETLELGEHDGALYLAMEWLDGEPLNVVLAHAAQRGGMPLPIAVNIVGQACRGLHAAHELRDEAGELLGVVHRDISPQNVIVTFSGTTKLVDFGIAKATSRVSSLTEAGEVKGKFAYMSPEQVSGAPIDRRSDVFAVGVLLYMLTTGRHPFKGEHPGETIRNISSDQPALPPTELLSTYPPALEAVVLRALCKAPADRWSTVSEMLEALEEALPECLETRFESRVAQYMNELLGHRLGERRKQLRLAEERADGSRTSLSAQSGPASYGSLGAVYIDRTGAISTRSQTGVSPVALPAQQPRQEMMRRGGRRVGVAVVGLALASSLAAAFSLDLLPLNKQQQAATAASPVPVATFNAIVPSPPPPPRTAPVPGDTQRDPSDAAEPHPIVAPENRGDPRTRERRYRRPAPGPFMAPATTAAPKAETSPPPAPSPAPVAAPKAEASSKAGVDAWDPSTFGGRH